MKLTYNLCRGRCGGDDVPPGDWACGLYGAGGSLGRAIYQCVAWKNKENKTEYWLKRAELCTWAGPATNGGQCARNSLRKGKRFYPFVNGGKAVCVTSEALNS
jgi:hypothetical protein